MAFAQASPLTQDGIVVNLPFQVIGRRGQRTPLALTVSDVDDTSGKSLTMHVVDGEITIDEPCRGDCDGDDDIEAYAYHPYNWGPMYGRPGRVWRWRGRHHPVYTRPRGHMVMNPFMWYYYPRYGY